MFFIFITPAQAINLNGEWTAEKGARGKLSQSGNTFSLVVTYSRFEKLIGITAVKGTITGDTFIGQTYTYTDECPNLDGLVPARGTISEGKIEVKFTQHVYNPDTCVNIRNAEPEGSITYTRVITPSPTFAEKPETEKQEGNTQPDQTQSEEKENLVIKALGGFPVLIGEWFNAVSTGWGLKEFFYQNELFADEVLFGRDRREIAGEKEAAQKKDNLQFQQSRKEILDKQGLADLDEVFNRIPVIKDEPPPDYKTGEWQQDSPFRLDILNGQVQIKLPGQNQWSDLKQGDRIPSGSTIFTGMDSTTVLSIRGKGVVQVESFTEITINEKGLEEAAEAGQTFTDIDLKTGEIEVNIESGVFTAPILQVNTPSVVAGVRGTHFWVNYNKDKRISTVGVYEGEVEVTAKGSDQTTLVSPNGDKPGVVVVSQKLSTVKLLIAGAVAVIIIGGIVFFLKKRGKSRSRGKR